MISVDAKNNGLGKAIPYGIYASRTTPLLNCAECHLLGKTGGVRSTDIGPERRFGTV